jgi:hypothetical protein
VVDPDQSPAGTQGVAEDVGGVDGAAANQACALAITSACVAPATDEQDIEFSLDPGFYSVRRRSGVRSGQGGRSRGRSGPNAVAGEN